MALGSHLLDLRRLLAACVHLARRGGDVIKEARLEGSLGAHNKKADGDLRDASQMAANEVLTVADGRAQDAIVTSLRGMFPGLRIVGEEGEVPGEATPTPLSEVPDLPHKFEVPEELCRSLTMADTCLWIDPLDGTKEFVLGNLENVSVLIGVAVNDKPVAGVIHKPYVGDMGMLTYGALGIGVLGDRGPAYDGPPAALVISSNPATIDHPRFKAAMERLDPQPKVVLAHACGQRFISVLQGEASAFVSFSSGSSRWDICAGEAMLAELGGKVTNLEGVEYKYVEGSVYDNTGGILAARTSEIHARLLEAFTPPGANGGDGLGEGEVALKRARTAS